MPGKLLSQSCLPAQPGINSFISDKMGLLSVAAKQMLLLTPSVLSVSISLCPL